MVQGSQQQINQKSSPSRESNINEPKRSGEPGTEYRDTNQLKYSVRNSITRFASKIIKSLAFVLKLNRILYSVVAHLLSPYS